MMRAERLRTVVNGEVVEVGIDGDEVRISRLALNLVDDARQAILDCRTGPLTEAILTKIDDRDIPRVVQALAVIAGTQALMDESGWAATKLTFDRNPDESGE